MSFSTRPHVIGRRVKYWMCCVLALCCIHGAVLLAIAQANEKLTSPDGKYSVEVVRDTEEGLVVSQSGKRLAKIATPVGPAGSAFEALWNSDGRYVAINKQRSSRPGGDETWIVALPSGKVMRKPDDGLWNDIEKKAWAFIDEKHLSETGGKVSLTLTATGWEKDRLRLRLEAAFSEMEDRYLFEGTLDPSNLRTISDWKVAREQR